MKSGAAFWRHCVVLAGVIVLLTAWQAAGLSAQTEFAGANEVSGIGGLVTEPMLGTATPAPVEGALVVLRNISTDYPTLIAIPDQEQKTNAHGKFLFTQVFPGVYELIVTKEGYREARAKVEYHLDSTGKAPLVTVRIFLYPLTGPTVTASPTPEPTLTPPPGEGFIFGRVVRADNSATTPAMPIAGARIEVRTDPELPIYPPAPPIAWTLTDDEGYYRLEGLPTNMPVAVVASKEGFLTQGKRFDGIPATGLRVMFALLPAPTPTVSPTPTLPPPVGTLYGTVFEVFPLRAGQEDSPIPPPERIPLPGAKIEVWIPYTTGNITSVQPLKTAISDEKGRYKITDLPVNVPLLAVASKEEYSTHRLSIPGLGEAPRQVDFSLHKYPDPTVTPTPTDPPPGKSGICGWVVEKTMLTVMIPIPGALVEVYPALRSGEEPVETPVAQAGSYAEFCRCQPIARAITDEKGEFCIVPLAPGAYVISARADGFLPTFRMVRVPEGDPVIVGLELDRISTPSVTPTPPPDTGALFGQVRGESADTSDELIPLPGAEVTAYPDEPVPTLAGVDAELRAGVEPMPMPVWRTYTDRDGRYVMPNLPAGSYIVVAKKVGFEPQKQTATITAGFRTELNYILERLSGPTPTPTPPPPVETGAIFGMVFDALADSVLPVPIPGADVLVFSLLATQEGTPGSALPILGRAKTNERGLYRIEQLPAVRVLVRAYKPGYKPNEVRAFVEPNTDTLVNIGLEMAETTPTPTPTVIPAEALLFGHVAGIAPDGTLFPIRGAKVCLLKPQSIADSTQEPVACVETDERGRYAMKVEPGEYAVLAEALGFQRDIKRVTLKAGTNPMLDFALTPLVAPTPTPQPEYGRVIGSVLQYVPPELDVVPPPIEGALVSLYRVDATGTRMNEPLARTRTDENGLYKFDRIPVGPYVGVAEKERYERDIQTLRVAAGQTTEAHFLLRPRIIEPTPTPTPQPRVGAIAGRVITIADEGTTRPIAGALVSAIWINRENLVESAISSIATAVTGPNGQFALSGLPAGEYLVVAKARGFEEGKVPAQVQAGETTRVVVALVALPEPDPETPGVITGRVVKPSKVARENRGRPLPDQLAYEPVEGSTVTSYLVLVDQSDPTSLIPSGQAITDADGLFELPGLTPGTHLVTAKAEGLHTAVRLARVLPGETTKVFFILGRASEDPVADLPPENIVDENRVGEQTTAHWEVDGSNQYERPDPANRDGWLALRSRGHECFGYWQSVRGWIPRRDDSIYRVEFSVASDQEDPAKSPSLRLRVNSDSYQQSDIFRINSLGDAGLAPTIEGTSYRMYFEPIDVGQARSERLDGLNVSFDLVNFDPKDAADGELTLQSLTIDAIPIAQLGEGTILQSWTFADGAPRGWISGGAAQSYEVPQAEAAARGLTLRARHQLGVYGYWSSPNDGFFAPDAGALLRFTFAVASDQVDPALVTQLRVRMHALDGQVAVLKVVESHGDGANSPTTAGKQYRLYFEVPPAEAGKALIASLDLLAFNPQDAEESALVLEGVIIEQLPAPTVE